MSEPQQEPDEHLGPVEIVAFELPAEASAKPWHELLAAVDRHLIRILDLEFLRRTGEDEAEVLDVDTLLTETGLELPALAGSSSGLLDGPDIVELLTEVEVGTTVAVLLVEHLSLLPVIRSFETDGARLMIAGPVSGDDLAQALDELGDEELSP
ncbi:MAG: hypothetical protein QM804_02375 [Propionicimonas sp.]